jgi:hypothetical protein
LQALFSQSTQNNAFDTNALTAFTLFSAASTSFDLVGTFDASTEVGLLGIWILICYVLFTAVVLVNLLIARMGNTHQRVSGLAVEEHAFLKATTVKQFLHTYENNPLSMLPAPLNLLLVPLIPLHFYCMDKKKESISVCGTVANFTLW